MTLKQRTIRVVAAVIEAKGRYLITQRRPTAVLPLMWEFPGGRVEEGESDSDALRREVTHRLGVDVRPGQLVSFVSHPYEHYDRCISCYRCVRVCAEQEGDYAISIANRGFKTQITTEFDGELRDSACTFCGQCVQTCPTGALAD
jgi:8-oxo-dGTP diphosphatase